MPGAIAISASAGRVASPSSAKLSRRASGNFTTTAPRRDVSEKNARSKSCPTAGYSMADFAPAIEYVLANEGGYNPNDNGAPSNFGIRQAGPYAQIDVKTLTRDEAVAIYERDFWAFGGFISQRVATKMLDIYVNEPPAIAIQILQRALVWLGQHITVDGAFGPITVAAVNASCADKLVDEIKFQLVDHYRKNADPSVLDGLLRRAVKG